MARTDIGTSAWPLMKITGRCRFALGQLVLKIEPAAPGQSDIEHQASGEVGSGGGKEFLNRGEQFDVQAHRSKKSANRLAYIRIVVDVGYPRLRLFIHYCHSKARWSLPAQ